MARDDRTNEELTDEERGMADELARELAFRERTKRIGSEKARITKWLKAHDIDPDTRNGVQSLVDRAAFLAVACQDLEDEIKRDGYTDRYQNGAAQWGTKQSPAVQSLSTFQQRLFAVMRQLTDLLPERDEGGSKNDPFDEYVKG